ncbi:type I-F CRISPR-associated protein Csy2 [Endozoicomonas sp. ALD040]|uniref:type I-F CRISPR-associated protein Csy2 n=1 Tax=Endozoicomonas sp. ALD040 TaxID=3403079 RepID=UPI003BB01133
MVKLSDLLEGKDSQERNIRMKHAFFSDVPVVIDGSIAQALIILANLTRSMGDKTDLFDEMAAKELFKSEHWHKGILATAPWVVTHYFKDPNSRASGCARWFPEHYGEDGQKHLGYSHNSNKVSKSHFLATEFFWHNRVTSLFEQFSNERGSPFIQKLITLGFPEKRVQPLQDACRGGMYNTLPDFVSPNSVVVSFPDGDGNYIAVTPLVEVGFQRWIHNLVRHTNIRCRPLFYAWPFQVSSFLATCGGKLYCLYYPPSLDKRDLSLESILDKWRSKKHVFNDRAIFRKGNLSFLLQLISNRQIVETERQRQERLSNERNKLAQVIEELFSFLFILRTHYLAGQSQISRVLSEALEMRLIQGGLNEEDRAAEYVLTYINTLFEHSWYSAQLSYNPDLLPLLEQAVNITLNKFTVPIKVPAISGRFLHFKRLLVYNANARSNPYVIGLPSLTAWTGLVHAFLCNLGYEPGRTDFRFAVVLRKYGLNKGHPASAQEMKNSSLVNSPVIDHRSCDVEFDLIVQLPETREEIDLSEDNLFGCLPSRFAGGTLTHPMEGIYGQCELYRKCDRYGTVEEVSASLVRMPSYGRVIVALRNSPERSELLKCLSQGKSFPIGGGFRFLGKPETRVGAGGCSHAFATPVVSVVALRPVQQINPLERAFWSITFSSSGIEVSVKENPGDEAV